MSFFDGTEELQIIDETWNLFQSIKMRRTLLASPTYTYYHDKDEFTLHKELKDMEKEYYNLTGITL